MRKETLRRIGWAIVPVSVVGFVWVGVAAAAFDAQKCERKKVFATGKYFKCLAKAEAKAIKKDRVADTAKCDEKFRKKLKRYEARGAGLCPTGQYFEEIRSRAAQELRFWGNREFRHPTPHETVTLGALPPMGTPTDPGTTNWTVNGRKLMLSINGTMPQPFLVKGVAYSPTQIGNCCINAPDPENQAIWEQDFASLRQLGANAIKIYGMDPNKDATPFLNAAWNNGTNPVYVILSIWIDGVPFPANSPKLQALIDGYTHIAATYGSHPAVMGYSIGAEFNSADCCNANAPAFWSQFNQIAAAVKDNLPSGSVKITTTGFVDDNLNTMVHGEDQNADIDVWGFDVYRGPTNGGCPGGAACIWPEVRSITTKPFLMTEFGAPASYHPSGAACTTENPECAEELPSSGQFNMGQLQAYLTSVWNNIEENSAPDSKESTGIGGMIFEWSDEWWKGSDADASIHTGTFRSPNHTFPGQWDDEEWFGLNSISPGSPNVMTPRPTYNTIQSLWTSP